MATVLYVEDELDLRADLAEELRDAGYETLEAANGQQGLDAILRFRPDLVICDVTMPGMNGIEMFHILRREHPSFDKTRFVFLSALEDVSSQIEDGLRVDGYLTKPVDFHAVLRMARRQIEAAEELQGAA